MNKEEETAAASPERRRARAAGEEQTAAATAAAAGGEEGEESGRDRLKRHRIAVAGGVWIPDTWGQEKLLKEWMDCAAIDRALVPQGLRSAREALVEECRQSNGGGFPIESRCLSA